ncbi:hypothetical protein [Paenibacillus lautus]|uniref:hypothetical protein n=1 Tax=Paenibacillus lautus TaxID=1401 RepID=UPI003D2A8117
MSYHHAIEKEVDRANPDPIIQPSSHLYGRKQNGEGVQRDYLDCLLSQVIQGSKVIQAFKDLQAHQVFRAPPEHLVSLVKRVPKGCRVFKAFLGCKASLECKAFQALKVLRVPLVHKASKDYPVA